MTPEQTVYLIGFIVLILYIGASIHEMRKPKRPWYMDIETQEFPYGQPVYMGVDLARPEPDYKNDPVAFIRDLMPGGEVKLMPWQEEFFRDMGQFGTATMRIPADIGKATEVMKNNRAASWQAMRTFLTCPAAYAMTEKGLVALEDLGVSEEYIERVTDDLIRFGKPRF